MVRENKTETITCPECKQTREVQYKKWRPNRLCSKCNNKKFGITIIAKEFRKKYK